MHERFGEIAYNAYCKARNWKSVKGEPLPAWDQQSQKLKDAWIAAAQAISVELDKIGGPG